MTVYGNYGAQQPAFNPYAQVRGAYTNPGIVPTSMGGSPVGGAMGPEAMYGMRGGMGMVAPDMYTQASGHGPFAGGGGYQGMGFEGLGDYARSYYPQQAAPFESRAYYAQGNPFDGWAGLHGSFDNAYSQGAIDPRQRQYLQMLGSDYAGMQNTLQSYGGYPAGPSNFTAAYEANPMAAAAAFDRQLEQSLASYKPPIDDWRAQNKNEFDSQVARFGALGGSSTSQAAQQGPLDMSSLLSQGSAAQGLPQGQLDMSSLLSQAAASRAQAPGSLEELIASGASPKQIVEFQRNAAGASGPQGPALDEFVRPMAPAAPPVSSGPASQQELIGLLAQLEARIGNVPQFRQESVLKGAVALAESGASARALQEYLDRNLPR